MTTFKADCRKFMANIFNPTKCQNCFRTKDAHSADALDNSKASRKITKCGYLFVAPDWDFSLYINRTKRRWFVLYDDGELTYSLDEHPETVPQAVIDMNNVLEVSDAEERTGNQYAISISLPEKVHFVKGTCKKEKKWWYDVLSRFPKFTNKNGKPRRNVTFPCVKGTSVINEAVKNTKNSRHDIMKIENSKSSQRSLLNNNYKNEINNTMPSNASDVIWNEINYYKEEFNDLHMKMTQTVIKTQDEHNKQMSSIDMDGLYKQMSSIDMDGLSLLRRKLNKANTTIKDSSQKLQEAYANYDYLEMAYDKLTKYITNLEVTHHAELQLMKQRIDDLTLKYTHCHRSLRHAKHRITKYESSHDPKQSSLKAKESLTLNREFDYKLKELEQKFEVINKILINNNGHHIVPEFDRSIITSYATFNCDKSNTIYMEKKELQRKSSQDSNCSESQMMCLRLHQLETKVKEIANNLSLSLSTPELRSSPKLSQHTTEKPKIRLQIKNHSDLNTDDWGSISLAMSMNDLRAIESSEDDNQSSINECPCCSCHDDDDNKLTQTSIGKKDCTEDAKNGDIYCTMQAICMDISSHNAIALRSLEAA